MEEISKGGRRRKVVAKRMMVEKTKWERG